MKSKIDILDFYLTAEYKNINYRIVICTDEKTLHIEGINVDIDITKEFDDFMENITKRYIEPIQS